jgi:hypothetical protein
MTSLAFAPARCTVQPPWKLASPARMGAASTSGAPLAATNAAKWSSESSEMGVSPSGPPCVPLANVIAPIDASTSTSGIHMVTQRVPSSGQ